MFIQLTRDLSNLKSGYIEVDRISGQKTITLGKSRFPANKEVFARNLKFYSRFLPDFPLPDQGTVNDLWNKASKYDAVDSLYYWGRMPVVGLAFGYWFIDTTAVLNGHYTYVIKVYDGNGQKIEEKRSQATVFKDKADLGKVVFTDSKYENGVLKLYFIQKEMPYLSTVRTYKRNKLNAEFKKVDCYVGFNQNNGQRNVLITDSTVIAPAMYQYYLVPLDLFGLPGRPSDTIFTGTYDFPYNLPLLDFKVRSDDTLRGVKLTWNRIASPVVKSIVIERSEVFDSGFVKVAEIPSTVNTFTDIYAAPMIKYYYRLKLTGYNGEISQPSIKVFGMFEDKRLPYPPDGVTAEGVEGGVKVQWVANEPYIDGYYVYRSTGLKDTLMLVSGMIGPEDSLVSFIDSSASLIPGRTYLYAVKAENTSHVKSMFSDTVAASPVKPEALIPPLDFTGYYDNGSIKLYWADMRNYNETVRAYHLRKRSLKENKVVLDTAFFADVNSFTDNDLLKGIEYEYVLTSVGLLGESGPAQPVLIKVMPERTLPPGNISARKGEGGVLVEWDPGLDNQVLKFNIYRYQRGQKPVLIHAAGRTDKPVYNDKNVRNGKLYFYFATSVSANGVESRPSREVSIVP
jgi:fibronectin type 3 domain-containing protein